MSAKIIISDDLRTRIVDCQAWMAAQTEETTAARARLNGEIAELQKTYRELAAKAIGLEAEIVRDTEAAAQLNAVTLRQERITQRLAELEIQLACIAPPSVASVTGLLEALISTWSEQLPAVIDTLLAPLIVQKPMRQQLGKMTNVWGNLRHLRGLSYQTGTVLTPGTVREINAIFERALAGQPLLVNDPEA